MAPTVARRIKRPQTIKAKQSLKRKREGDEVAALDQAVAEIDTRDLEIKNFSDLPLSKPTSRGLEASHFKALTDIQARALPLALKGADCLGAAKTGSGKTLAFLVPVLENLYRKRWTELDGLGALIISPTRELAIQIFEVLRKIGRYHTFSAGLVIGGKSLQEERERLARMNILVCTPGRMQQHMDQTAGFEIDNLQMLVLDEADRIMDMGFRAELDAIVNHLPEERQTLLFSATQTKKVSDLARLSVREPEYIAVHLGATSATPSTLQQHYIVTPLSEKLDTLWSFLLSNIKAKILVFLSSGKQVRFVYESFRHLQPGIPLLHLHGRQRQTARLDITSRFSASKNSCLLATDVAARGLDFPAVDWVIQIDCPEDVDTYIHRVGRTARYEHDGRAVLFLDPSEEEGMLKRLEQRKVPIEKLNVRQKKQQSIRSQLQNMCFKDPELKYLGQKAFVSYVTSIHLQGEKEIFNVKKLLLEDFATSLGLPGAPRIRFLKGDNAKTRKNAPRHGISSSEDDDEQDATTGASKRPKLKEAVRTKYDKMFERRNQDVLTEHYARLVDVEEDGMDRNGDADEDDDFLTVKRRLNMEVQEDLNTTSNTPNVSMASTKSISMDGKDPLAIDSKRREKLLESKKKLLKLKGKGTKLVYDEDGNPHAVYKLEDEDGFKQRGTAESQRSRFLEEERERVQAADRTDKQLAKEKRREFKERKRAREKAERRDEDEGEGEGGGFQAVLAPYDEAEGGVEGEALSVDVQSKPEPPRKRPKKWFEDDSENEVKDLSKRNVRVIEAANEPATLEDLEALAAGLLQ
ncbi:MAG: ATP-dependent RNA helicase dbp4 [Pycnora praestabilis]|nr:MAG: ATP-dependent RNA helicase dbp4 [Pycnora praestabilis]